MIENDKLIKNMIGDISIECKEIYSNFLKNKRKKVEWLYLNIEKRRIIWE